MVQFLTALIQERKVMAAYKALGLNSAFTQCFLLLSVCVSLRGNF